MNEINIFHKIKEFNGNETIYIYVDLNDSYEFGSDFFKFNKKEKQETSFIGNISKYANEKLQDKKGDIAIVVVNGVIIRISCYNEPYNAI